MGLRTESEEDAPAPLPSRLEKAIEAAKRIGWRNAAIGACALIVAIFAIRWSFTKVVLGDDNQEAGVAIVSALETHRAVTGRYPEKLAQLQPKFLAAIPQPAADTNFVYAASSDGKICWFGYQTNRGMLNEYDSQTRRWTFRDYDDSDALRSRSKEFVMGPR